MGGSFTDLHTALQALPERERCDVDLLMAQATAYVWGWQDAGGERPA